MMKIVRPLRNGQITLPVQMRERLGIDEATLLQLYLTGKEIRLRPVRVTQSPSGSPWLKELYHLFDQSRQIGKKYSSGQIEADIRKAIKAVHKK